MSRLSLAVLSLISLFFGLIMTLNYFDRNLPINQTTKTCLITGASSGIGKHLAIEMVARGWKVIGIARRKELLDTLQKELGENNFIPFVCDVSHLEAIATISQTIKTQGLSPTLFFLNAGAGELEPKWKFSVKEHQNSFSTNYLGTMAWIEHWLLRSKELGGGTFIAISSVCALFALPGSAAYCASKAALMHSFAALNRQYLNDSIGFTTVLPGPVNTEMLKGDNSIKDLLFIHEPENEAKYIINKVFAGKKQIEPSWFYSLLFRIFNVLPDTICMKFL